MKRRYAYPNFIAKPIYIITGRIGCKMEEKGMTGGKWSALFKFMYSAESRYNCMIDPELGERIRLEAQMERWTRFVYRKGRLYQFLDHRSPKITSAIQKHANKLWVTDQERRNPGYKVRLDAVVAKYLDKYFQA